MKLYPSEKFRDLGRSGLQRKMNAVIYSVLALALLVLIFKFLIKKKKWDKELTTGSDEK